MTRWFDSRFTGLFSEAGAVRTRAHDPAVALSSGVTLRPWRSGGAFTAGGAGWEPATAEAARVGEAVERLAGSPEPGDGVRDSSFEDWQWPEAAQHPSSWVLFHPEQYGTQGFPFHPLTPSTRCRWVAFREAVAGEAVWVPEELAYLHPGDPVPHRFVPGLSTGLACARDARTALLRALQEVVERDALVGAWWGRYALREWEAAEIWLLLGRELASRLVRPNLRYRFYGIDTPFGGHATLVTVEGEDQEGAVFSTGSACRETREESLAKSLLEAVQGRHCVRHLLTLGPLPPRGAPPATFAEHALYYSVNPEALAGTPLARALPASVSREAAERESLGALAARLGPSRPVLFRLMTPTPISSEFVDWVVMKVAVPGLQPLHGHHDLPQLGGPLWAPRGLAEWAGMLPHPFA